MPSVYANEGGHTQLAISPLPVEADLEAFKLRLHDEYRIDIPLTEHLERPYLRLSVQGYNTRADLDVLVSAVGEMV